MIPGGLTEVSDEQAIEMLRNWGVYQPELVVKHVKMAGLVLAKKENA